MVTVATKFEAVLMMEASTVVLHFWRALLKLRNINTLKATRKTMKTKRMMMSSWNISDDLILASVERWNEPWLGLGGPGLISGLHYTRPRLGKAYA